MNKNKQLIYILSTSYSGSTILGLLLGTDNKIVNLGEIKKTQEVLEKIFHLDPNKEHTSLCTCGKIVENCPYWAPILKNFIFEKKINPQPGFSLKNFSLYADIFFNTKNLKKIKNETYIKLINKIFNKKIKNNYLLDNSKSLYHLNCLLNSGQYELKIIYLYRDPSSVVNSFKKHGFSFLHGLFNWLLSNSAIKKFLRNRGDIDLISIDYADLCQNTDQVLKKINNFLNTNLDSKRTPNLVNQTTFHILAGNPLLNKLKKNKFSLSFNKNLEFLSQIEKLLTKKINNIVFKYEN